MLIQFDHVDKDYLLGGQVLHAVRNACLRIDRGEFVAFAGPSGSGKSTLFSLMAAMTAPTRGTVQVDGVDVGRIDSTGAAHLRRRLFGFVFQSFNLMPVLTAFENIELPLLLGALDASARSRRVMAIAERLGISALLHHRPDELSGGQKQRVAIARALVGEPQLVIADEPTANLDSETGQVVLELARELCRQKGVCFLFSSHDPTMIHQADRVVRLKDGLLAEAPPTPAVPSVLRLAEAVATS